MKWIRGLRSVSVRKVTFTYFCEPVPDGVMVSSSASCLMDQGSNSVKIEDFLRDFQPVIDGETSKKKWPA